MAIAAIYLPPEFEKDLLAGRRPRPVAFYNTQYFTPGNNASKSISDAMTAAVHRGGARDGALSPHTAETPPGLVPEEYVLTNPAFNYAAVPAARGAADRAACGDRDLRGLRGRVGVPSPRHPGMVGHLRPQHRDRAGRQAAAVLPRADDDVRVDGRHPRRGARRELSRQRAADDRLRDAADRCLPDDRLPDAVADPKSGPRPQPDRRSSSRPPSAMPASASR